MLRSAISLFKFPLKDASCRASIFKSPNSRILTAPLNNFHTTVKLTKTDDRQVTVASLPKIDEGTVGETSIGIDSIGIQEDIFPDENTPNRLFNGVPFREIPIINIRVSHNNTIISVTDHKGVLKLIRSCGVEGFKNTRKGTNIAAQATAISLSLRALEQGYKMVRVKVRGLGPGRMSAIKGLQMGGMQIVSVTDATRVTWNPLRPRKARRL